MIRYVMLANQNFKDINPLDCGEEKCSPDFILKNRVFKYYIFHYAYSGAGVFEIDGVKHRLEKDSFSIVRPNQQTTYYADRANPWHYVWIGFECSIPLPFDEDDVILHVPQAKKIFKEIAAADSIMFGRENYICSKIHELFALLYQSKNSRPNDCLYLVNSAKNFIENYYYTRLTLDQIAEKLSISKSYFCAIFKKHTGISPYDYLIKTRLDNAFNLLSLHNMPVKNVALEVGYPDAFSFSKCFKKRFGFSPSEVKRMGRNKMENQDKFPLIKSPSVL